MKIEPISLFRRIVCDQPTIRIPCGLEAWSWTALGGYYSLERYLDSSEICLFLEKFGILHSRQAAANSFYARYVESAARKLLLYTIAGMDTYEDCLIFQGKFDAIQFEQDGMLVFVARKSFERDCVLVHETGWELDNTNVGRVGMAVLNAVIGRKTPAAYRKANVARSD